MTPDLIRAAVDVALSPEASVLNGEIELAMLGLAVLVDPSDRVAIGAEVERWC